ncbi:MULTISPECIES: type II toxin-antitoxin system death-on-curing family toxin [unclassified Leptolyngbya]|uniref:type II toxin-antitoxin system death-on-curing family toxin n=1 Tax=unclassified Leptolyngbya TaxID=2650499 RepID=UPI00168A3DB5|nr:MULTISPECIES: type II toxin-antitoxin system death-on-curing family toxin [unclassified Leptolyngbya]MBD1911442.1 type II toxin-antitoxin system death-on-curing family toxin [Leptolyngbya sp. FACHB-8]MBD2153454.1 type II toxin-antitoxin system death-on-curing family toxin [Leptolyngbya sp. FACHB-16]
MIRYLTLIEVLELHRRILEQSGGALGIRDIGLLEAAIAQPRMTFGGENLYPGLLEKAVALGFSIIMNHSFVDGNKRTGHAATETFLVLNGMEINASVDEQEHLVLAITSGELRREAFLEWLQQNTTAR